MGSSNSKVVPVNNQTPQYDKIIENEKIIPTEVAIPAPTLPPKESTLPFPKYGIKICIFDDFIEENGGIDVFQGLTTTDVCNKFILAKGTKTELNKSSYWDIMNNEGNSNVNNKATVFISHAWKYIF